MRFVLVGKEHQV